MNIEIVGIPLLFTVVTSLLLWFIVGSKGHWFFKLFITSVSLYSTFLIWSSFSELGGYPVEEELPSKFRMHWAVVRQEMNKIFILAATLDEHHHEIPTKSGFISHPAGVPRIYTIPYSQEGHKDVNKALEIIKSGGKVVGGVRGKGEGNNGNGNKGKQGGRKGQKCEFSTTPDLHFYLLPPVELPPKDPLP